jgi:pimeloyl-ACP methyl ester carboxylesterase
MTIGRCSAAVCGALIPLIAFSQGRPESDPILRQLETKECAVTSSAKICRYDYSADGRRVEAISFQPRVDGPSPGVLMIPGFQRTAKNLVQLGVQLADNGFAGVAVSQPGFGGSEGPADYVGPLTIKVLKVGFEKLRNESWVDPKRMGVYGYSRGAIAASILALELRDLKAAVFGAGAYDFQQLYDTATLPGVRANMKAETGMTPQAIRERSPILRMDRLQCPVLILHGEEDKNVPGRPGNFVAQPPDRAAQDIRDQDLSKTRTLDWSGSRHDDNRFLPPPALGWSPTFSPAEWACVEGGGNVGSGPGPMPAKILANPNLSTLQ